MSSFFLNKNRLRSRMERLKANGLLVRNMARADNGDE